MTSILEFDLIEFHPVSLREKWRVGGGQPGVCASGRNVNRLVLVGDLRVDE